MQGKVKHMRKDVDTTGRVTALSHSSLFLWCVLFAGAANAVKDAESELLTIQRRQINPRFLEVNGDGRMVKWVESSNAISLANCIYENRSATFESIEAAFQDYRGQRYSHAVQSYQSGKLRQQMGN